MLYYDRWVYRLERLPSGETCTIDEGLTPLDARTVLTRKMRIGDTDAAEVYAPNSDDVARILEIQMLHGIRRRRRPTRRWKIGINASST